MLCSWQTQPCCPNLDSITLTTHPCHLWPGKEQAELTGKRLAKLSSSYGEKSFGFKFTALTHSSMARAKETAEIIHRHVLATSTMDNDPMLAEGAPIPPEPPVGHWKPEKFVSAHHRSIQLQKVNIFTIYKYAFTTFNWYNLFYFIFYSFINVFIFLLYNIYNMK